MEIERKWMVTGWPEGLPMEEEFAMRQGYISVRPTVRIREEALAGGRTDYVLCFKSEGGLAREEIERSMWTQAGPPRSGMRRWSTPPWRPPTPGSLPPGALPIT